MQNIAVPIPKRIFDILVGCVLAVALFPFLFFLSLIYILEQILIPSSRGPLFYKETRISQGKPFHLWKIRTFKVYTLTRAMEAGTIHTKRLEADRANLTYTGRLLRQIYMDEAPQIFSVLVGDMSFVGPRPTNTENYERDVAKGLFAKRILRAGLTGRFQTHKHKKYGLNQETVDLEYAEFCQTKSGLRIVTHDFWILTQTVITVLRAEGL